MTNSCLLWETCVCHDKTCLLSWRKYACRDKTKMVFVMTWQNLCREKHVFLTTSIQNYACYDKHNFVATSILLSRLTVTRVCHDKTVVVTKMIFLWQLPPVIHWHTYTLIFLLRSLASIFHSLFRQIWRAVIVFLGSYSPSIPSQQFGSNLFQVSPLNLASIVYPDAFRPAPSALAWSSTWRFGTGGSFGCEVPEHRADQGQIYSNGCARHSACCLSADMCIAHVLAAGTHTDARCRYAHWRSQPVRTDARCRYTHWRSPPVRTLTLAAGTHTDAHCRYAHWRSLPAARFNCTNLTHFRLTSRFRGNSCIVMLWVACELLQFDAIQQAGMVRAFCRSHAYTFNEQYKMATALTP